MSPCSTPWVTRPSPVSRVLVLGGAGTGQAWEAKGFQTRPALPPGLSSGSFQPIKGKKRRGGAAASPPSALPSAATPGSGRHSRLAGCDTRLCLLCKRAGHGAGDPALPRGTRLGTKRNSGRGSRSPGPELPLPLPLVQ